MAKKHLKNEPQNLGENAWWYEDTKGIDLHFDTVCPNGQRSHESYLIPWKVIRNALERKDRNE